MQVRVYNDFKRRLLNGEVSADFPCTAVLLNSTFDNMYDTAAYFRNVNDFYAYSPMSLYKIGSEYDDMYYGSLIAKGKALETTYYRDKDINAIDLDNNELMIVTSANASAYRAMYARGTTAQNKRFDDYIDKFGYFYLVARADDFHTLVSRTQSLNMERFVVVLADDIEHIDVTGSCFGCSREYPFRGIFDGNGYALCLHSMQMNSRSNGIFGYISDEAIVRNVIISADSTNIDESDSEISVTNSEQISLNTLKAGLGDVKFGILAGVNNGTVENVVIDAKLCYKSEFTPSFSFVQNKTDYPTELVGESWKQLSSTDFTEASALSSFTNLCYPTPLCLNSEANLIPYVGYFNEGSLNTQTVSLDVTQNNPLYTNTKDAITNTYLSDIYQVYKTKCPELIVQNYLELIGDKSNGISGYLNNYPASLSFRLGPNNKQAYLLGGMFGLNNGDVKDCVCDVQMKFNDNVVALAGGLAGRGARGNLTNVAARAKFVGTSGTYTHDYQLVNEQQKNTIASATFVEEDYATMYYTPDIVNTLSASTLTKFTYNFEESTASTAIIPNFGTLVSANINTDSYGINLDTRGTLTLIGSGYRLTNSESQQSEVDVSDKELFLIYNYNVTDEYLPPSGMNFVYPFSAIDVNGEWIPGTDPINVQLTVQLSNRNIPLKQSLSTYNLYAMSSHTTNGIKLITSETNLLLASAVDNTCKINQQNKIAVKDLILTSEYAMCYQHGYYRARESVSGTVKFNLSAYDVKVNFDETTANIRALTTMHEADNVNIRLAPVFNMGGMFGEYVYSNDQSVNNSFTCAEASGFKWLLDDSQNKTHGFKHFNNVSHFASNVIIDSSNKSNSDLFVSSYAASANARVRNVLDIYLANVIDGVPSEYAGYSTVYKSISSVADSDDCTSAINAFNTLNIYNHITPSVVTTNYTDRDSRGGDEDDLAPNLGITWLDQLFYSYGINMGYNYIPDPSIDATDYKQPFKQFNNPSACSGWYFNFPAQGKVFDATIYAGRPKVSANDSRDRFNTELWKYDSVFSAAFDMSYQNTVYPANSIEKAQCYVTKQLTAYPNQYPLYRGRASLNSSTKLTYEQSAYMKVPVQTRMSAYSAIDVRKAELIDAAHEMHQDVVTDSYIYEYEQNVYSHDLPQLKAHLYSVYGSFTSYDTRTEVENAFVLSSNSYEDVYKKNGYASTHITAGTCDVVIPSSGYDTSFDIDIVNAYMTECATGTIVKFNITTEYGDTPEFEVRDDSRCYLVSGSNNAYAGSLTPARFASELLTVYNNTLYVEYPFTILTGSNLKLAVPMKLKYTLNNTEKTANTIAYIPITRTSVYTLDHKFDIDTRIRNDNVLSANTLCFGFVPMEKDIISVLDKSVNASAYARTLSSDDISYMLLLDNEQRPIVDMKFDTTAVASAGFYVEFESLRKNFSDTTLSAGLLINITK